MSSVFLPNTSKKYVQLRAPRSSMIHASAASTINAVPVESST
jgi:hypothetical protein